MGKRAQRVRTQGSIRQDRLPESVRLRLKEHASYEGSPHHKRNPGDFGLTPPAAPRPDKTLCDEAGVFSRTEADRLFRQAVEAGLVSVAATPDGYPKRLWVVDDEDRVFEAMYGGSRTGCYHGYPVRRSNPQHRAVLEAWRR
jgi:hypothetical protein